ncbi:MAG: hydrogenase nickel incorporation protein HypA [Staphylothermus sp.]|nr:hydrogenase nickel incorporation protein HypA [Staphylothermus sp.]
MVHEWALAESIADYIEQELRKTGKKKVVRIIIKLGILQSIDKEILDFALNEIIKLRGYSVGEIIYEDEDVVLKCRRCGYEWRIDPSQLDEAVREAIHFVPEAVYSYFMCPRCGSRDFEIIRGRGIGIKEIVLGDDNE